MSTVQHDHCYNQAHKYSCSVCSKRFRTEPGLKSHNKRHSAVKKHTCHECGKCFYTKADLHCHSIVNHGLRTRYCCKLCHNYWICEDMFVQHMRTHHGENRIYRCRLCAKSFKTIGKFRVHHAFHFERKLGGVCPICFKSFTDSRILHLHKCDQFIGIKLEEDYTTTDSVNDTSIFKLKNKTIITVEVSDEHSLKRQKCEQCSQRFAFVDLLRHLAWSKWKDNTPKFTCNICLKIFNYRCKLQRHNRLIVCEPSTECVKCGKAFKTGFIYEQHVKYSLSCGNETIKVVKCPDCFDQFNDKCDLNKHRKETCAYSKKGNKSELRLTCKKSQRTLTDYVQRSRPGRTCAKPKFGIKRLKYECHDCGLKFVLQKTLIEHWEQGCDRVIPKTQFENRAKGCDQAIGVKLEDDASAIKVEDDKSTDLENDALSINIKNTTIITVVKEVSKKHSLKRQKTKSSKRSKIVLRCKQCNQTFPSGYLLNRHSAWIKREDDTSKLTCDVCLMEFCYRCKLEKHKQSKACGNSSKCLKCGNTFKRGPIYEQHVMYSLSCGNETTTASCLDCGRNYRYCKCNCGFSKKTCNKCKKTFSWIKSYNFHIRYSKSCGNQKYISKPKNLKCDDCGRMFALPKTLAFHKARMCRFGPKEKPTFICAVCNKICTCKTQLEYHMISHTKERNYECVKCNKKFLYKPHLQNHYRENPVCGEGVEFPKLKYDPGKLICEHCGRVGFKHNHALKQHIRIHFSTEVVCQKCGTKLSNMDGLRAHMKYTCLGDKICTICGKKGLKHKTDFLSHMKEHDTNSSKRKAVQGKFVCPKCGKFSARRDDLDSHKSMCVATD